MKEFQRSPTYSTGFCNNFSCFRCQKRKFREVFATIFRVSDARSESFEKFLQSMSLGISFIGGDRYFHSIADVCGYECV